MTRAEIIRHFNSDNSAELFAEADRVRLEYCGEAVHLRGLIEFSNVCARDCWYCGLRRSNRQIERYQMAPAEILAAARAAHQLGYKSIVLQSGENDCYPLGDLTSLIAEIKQDTDLAVTLSIGEKTAAQYAALKAAGADRYLLRFETSSEKIYQALKPDSSLKERLRCLSILRDAGFQVGSGIMVGLPGQSVETLAEDILLLEQLDLDMIGIGPFIANPLTPLKDAASGTLAMTLKTVALLRIITKNTHIPATTAMGSIDPQGRQKALSCGANVLMPNVTPTRHRQHYQLYPGKICLNDAPEDCLFCVEGMARSLGREIGKDQGHSYKIKGVKGAGRPG
ncbi:MAG: [FeFe] hydrogenase H-cluster radical SAM maturase HydE [Candidatus Omnitrophica bacterium]|nr:[FeFe] hydrogenase H-cluster radical SAM maturase HydE [Candidatus Omnitrophota bacterium]